MNLRIGSILVSASLCAPAQDKKLEFDVASVRVSEGPAPARAARLCPTPTTCEKPPSPIQGGPGTSDPERMTFPHFSMEGLLITAFAVSADQIAAPDSIQKWLSYNLLVGTHYDIVAKVPPGAAQAETSEMLKNLLVERFGLAYHGESESSMDTG